MHYTVEQAEKVVAHRTAMYVAFGVLVTTLGASALKDQALPRDNLEWTEVLSVLILSMAGSLMVMHAWFVRQAFAHQPFLYYRLLASQSDDVLKAPSFLWLHQNAPPTSRLIMALQQRLDYWPGRLLVLATLGLVVVLAGKIVG
jgi:hypothetical protein